MSTIENPFTPNGMFHTPENPEELAAWLNNFNGHEKIIVLTAMNMTWNLASKMIDEALEEAKAT